MSRSGIYDLKYGFIPDDDVPQEPPKQTNADRIRMMTDEELATALYLLRLDALQLEGFEGTIETKEEVLEWLREEAE